MLDKKALLRKLISINNEANLEKNTEFFKSKDISIEINDILEKATINFFPKEGKWYSYCFQKPKYLKKNYLPCHLRDDLWLAKMLKKDQELFNISINEILQFVKTSTFFQEKRHEYEQEIVKWQIDWMISGGENWLVDKNYDGDFIFLSPLCDLGFRKGIVDTLSKIGISIDAIEEGIERNSDSWRDLPMKQAFYNKYQTTFSNIDFTIFSRNKKQTKQEDENLELYLEFKEKWLKLRKYEYYQRHKCSVDKYGIIEPDMTLSAEEVDELKAYLKLKHNEIISQKEQFEQEKKRNIRTIKNFKKIIKHKNNEKKLITHLI